MEKENVQWKVDGMDCSSCALTIHKYLEKQGMKNVKVNSVSGDVSFQMNGGAATPKIIKGLSDLGYQVANQQLVTEKKKPFFIKQVRHKNIVGKINHQCQICNFQCGDFKSLLLCRIILVA